MDIEKLTALEKLLIIRYMEDHDELIYDPPRGLLRVMKSAKIINGDKIKVY